MDFLLSKLLWLAVNPGNLMLLLLIVSAVLLFNARTLALAKRLIAGLLFLTLAISVLPLGLWLYAPLEARFQPPEPIPQQVTGIVVLGGFVDPVMSQRTGQVELGGAVERLTAMLELARLYPQARFVFSGGSGSVLDPDALEAPLVRKLLDRMGFDTGRVAFEQRSRNTFENAIYSKELARPSAGETWLLVTSAAHMPRAVGCFRMQGWEVLAWPVDHLTGGGVALGDISFNMAGGFGVLGAAVHEWLGLAAYKIMGRTTELFPAP